MYKVFWTVKATGEQLCFQRCIFFHVWILCPQICLVYLWAGGHYFSISFAYLTLFLFQESLYLTFMKRKIPLSGSNSPSGNRSAQTWCEFIIPPLSREPHRSHSWCLHPSNSLTSHQIIPCLTSVIDSPYNYLSCSDLSLESWTSF